MCTLIFNINVVLVLFLGLVLAFGDAFETRINHKPWWSYESNANGLETSYKYYYPHNHQRQYHKTDNTRWNYPSYHKEYKKDNIRWKSQTRQQDHNIRWKSPTRQQDHNIRWKSPTRQQDHNIRWKSPTRQQDHNIRWKSPTRQQDRKKNNSRWNYPSMDFSNVKLPPMPAVPKPTYSTREWPDYIPPVRMIKLPLDEPPAF